MVLAALRSFRFSRPWSRGAARSAAYRLRLLVGLVVSLGAVTAAFRMPWGGGPRAVGWGTPPADAFEVTFEKAEPNRSEPEADLASRYRIAPPAGGASAPAEVEGPPAQTAVAATPPDVRTPTPKLEKLAPILEFAEEAPEIVGGLGDLYLHIRYPQAAIDRGIQGQLVLRFVVEPDGRASEIVVEKSLHPLCDSAAVRALREVAFMPGRQNGEAARVRMRLPVRFRLVDPGGKALPDSSS